MSQNSALKKELVEMATDLRDMLNDLYIEDSLECELCGAAEYEIQPSEYRCSVAEYETGCVGHRCDGEVRFTKLSVSVGDYFSAADQEFRNVSCSEECGVTPERLVEAVDGGEPIAAREWTLTMGALVTNAICKHHTRYEPEQTMFVCDSCHVKIHHDDSFRPDLQPEMMRKDWEKAQ